MDIDKSRNIHSLLSKGSIRSPYFITALIDCIYELFLLQTFDITTKGRTIWGSAFCQSFYYEKEVKIILCVFVLLFF